MLLQTAQTLVQSDEDWEADGSGRSICDSYAAERHWRRKSVSHVLRYSVECPDVDARTRTLQDKVSSAHASFKLKTSEWSQAPCPVAPSPPRKKSIAIERHGMRD